MDASTSPPCAFTTDVNACGVINALLGADAALPCPNNICEGINGAGRPVAFQAFTVGGGGYYTFSGPGAVYYSEDQAGQAALDYVKSMGALSPYWNYETNQLGVEEWGGNIYVDQDDIWSFTEPIQGPFCAEGSSFCTIDTKNVPIPDGAADAGLYHTHPDWWIPNIGFSAQDYSAAMGGAFGYAVPSYLLTLAGTIAVFDLNLPAPHIFVFSGPPFH
jgi:hypothetical protein